MQFKHPEILYALLLLLIPIIVHLFQLRRFQKVPFTNVAFLKEVSMQTRKSSTIKKWLTLLTRLLLLAAIILAFAQPYTSNKKSFKTKKETVIFLDNSFSLQAKGDKGPLLQRSIQDLIASIDNTEIFTLITNNKTFKNTTLNAIKKDLLELSYSPNQLDYNAALLQAKKSFTKDESNLKNLIFISDFQEKDEPFKIEADSVVNLNLVQLKPVNPNNISVDSLYISNTTTSNLELSVLLRNQGDDVNDVSVSLFNNDNLLAKSSVNITKEAKTIFTLPINEVINGKITINDAQLQFDNTLYFNLNKPEKINVLSINNSDDEFLKKVYSNSEFNYQSVAFNQLNYNDLEKQNLIVLNELKSIPNSLITALNLFKNNGGNLLIIPSDDITLSSYNQLLKNFNSINFSSLNTQGKRITKINFSHPLFKNVFNNNISNFQYPKVNSFYPVSTSQGSSILNYEDGKSFLSNSNNLYVFSSALNSKNSNFKNSPLIVPTLYNIGKQSLQLSKPYYTIGSENKIDINTTLQQDEILTFVGIDSKVIPQQQTFKNKVTLTTNETPDLAGIYAIVNNDANIENISYNFNRSESYLSYINFKDNPSVSVSNSITEVLNTIKSNTKINELWKWFVIFALLMLIIEMLILKFFK